MLIISTRFFALISHVELGVRPGFGSHRVAVPAAVTCTYRRDGMRGRGDGAGVSRGRRVPPACQRGATGALVPMVMPGRER